MSPLSPSVRAASCGEFRRVRALSYTFSTVGWRACAGLSPTRRLSRNGVVGNDDQGSGQFVGRSEVILRLLTAISNGKSDCVDRRFQSFSVIRINSEALFPGPPSALIRCRPSSTVDNEVPVVYLMPLAIERRESPV